MRLVQYAAAMQMKLENLKLTSGRINLEDVEAILRVRDYAVNRNPDDSVVAGRSLADYKVDERFKMLFTPCEVGVKSDRAAINLVVKETSDNEVKLPSPTEFIDAQDRILSVFKTSMKAGNFDVVNLTEAKSLIEVIEYVVNDEGLCHWNGVPFVPIHLTINNLFKGYWYNMEEKEMVEEVFRALAINLAGRK